MKILSAKQLREVDKQTLRQQGISEAELIDRAGHAFVKRFLNLYPKPNKVLIFCGPGNNGKDGMVVGRVLFQKGVQVEVYLVQLKENEHLRGQNGVDKVNRFLPLHFITHVRDLPIIAVDDVVVDALFGTGLNREVSGLAAEVIGHINDSLAKVVSIDIPSGLHSDEPTRHQHIVKANQTITFELPKLAFFLPNCEEYVGEWSVVPIELDKQSVGKVKAPYHYVTRRLVAGMLRPRGKFSHKGTFGFALIIGGSHGMMGAAILAAKGCLRSGIGKLRVNVPASGYHILQTTIPEALTLTDPDQTAITELPEDITPFTTIGIGPGLGQEDRTLGALQKLIRESKVPLVIDADALSLLGKHRELLEQLPPDSILTPHPKEFERMAGASADNFEQLLRLQAFSRKYKCYTVLKGAYTCTCTPEGECFFNSTGNPGMATGGSGDVLMGVITSLRAQGYPPLDSCLLGVYLHGLSGDLARDLGSEYSLIASDLTAHLGEAFQLLEEVRKANC